MTVSLSLSDHTLILVSLETRLQRIDTMIKLFKEDANSMVPVYQKERQEVQELIDKLRRDFTESIK